MGLRPRRQRVASVRPKGLTLKTTESTAKIRARIIIVALIVVASAVACVLIGRALDFNELASAAASLASAVPGAAFGHFSARRASAAVASWTGGSIFLTVFAVFAVAFSSKPLASSDLYLMYLLQLAAVGVLSANIVDDRHKLRDRARR